VDVNFTSCVEYNEQSWSPGPIHEPVWKQWDEYTGAGAEEKCPIRRNVFESFQTHLSIGLLKRAQCLGFFVLKSAGEKVAAE
jgi:hypothetical protein